MIILIFLLAIGLQFVYLGGNLYAGIKFYRLHHRWGPFVALTFFGNSARVLCGFLAFALRPRSGAISWRATAVEILGLFVQAACVVVLNLFLFGWINGVGGYAKSEAKNDPE